MAKKRKFIQETNRTFGLLNPIQESIKGDVFKMSVDSIGKYKSQLYTLIFTNKGERVMMPEFGTNIPGLLFDPIAENLYENIRADIIIACKRWIPAIRIDRVAFINEEENTENNIINMSIEYSLKVDSNITDQIQIEMSM